MNEETVSSETARGRFRETLDNVEHHDAHITLLRYGRPVAVIVPVGWYGQVGSLVADLGEWLVPAMEDLDRLAEWQAKANAVRTDVPVEDPS